MPAERRTLRLAAVLGALAVGAVLTGCTAPAASTCPPGLVETANAKATENGMNLAFSAAAVGDFEPAALQSWIQSACVIAFTGDLGSGTAVGHFAFTTEDIDEPAFALAVNQLGYDGENGTWAKQDATTGEADVITASAPSADGGSIVDLSQAFPEAKLVISSFHFTGS